MPSICWKSSISFPSGQKENKDGLIVSEDQTPKLSISIRCADANQIKLINEKIAKLMAELGGQESLEDFMIDNLGSDD